MNKWFWVILSVIVVGLIGVFIIANRNDTPQANNDNQDPMEVVEQDHARGNVNSQVVLVEYGDFQCPACGAFYPLLKQAEDEYGDRVKFVFRHFPLSSLHPNAFSASRAAEAAGKQGKFWEMHDILYERQNEWSEDTNALKKFREYAQELGLDANRFNEDYASNETTSRINQDVNNGKSLDITGTPTFYLNGQKIDLARDYNQIKAKLDEALNNQGN